MKALEFLLALALLSTMAFAKDTIRFSISYPDTVSSKPQDGRLLLLLSNNPEKEPRRQITDGINSQLVFGIDVEGMKPGEERIVDEEAFGHPIRSLKDVPAGEYFVQALLNRYETFHLKTGHTVKLPPEMGEGQQWNEKPGNFYSKPVKLKIDPKNASAILIVMDQKIPPIQEPADTKYVQHIKMQSKLLTEFWGRPVYVGGHVLVPHGFDEHPEARYPLMIFHGHFPADVSGFRTEPPDPNLKPDYSERFRVSGYNKIQQEEAYKFYQQWISKDFPRFLALEIQHANPYYDDSYAVNSANLGPYGDAITYELIPFIEKKFRAIGQPWSRFLYGGSTGGWEALAAQVFYPDEYNGAFGACPDPVDFRSYMTINIYEDKNAYYYEGQFARIPRPAHRNYLGQLSATMEQNNYFELALGTKSRSGQQFDIWEAVYSPQDQDGYPKRIYDKLTGKIDPEVAKYWKENFDLRHILERDWSKLGPKLEGKLHLYCGDMDNYYLNNAVYFMEEFLEKTKNPHYGGEVDYGDRAEHCWNGDHNNPNHLTRLRYHTMYLDRILKRIEKTAPSGADLKSWRY
ncbi:hypothetical protein L0222_05075 [bacterium]|nr:hypothetical protein [bacterium]MCI0603257.1 hypothetical protein [bacterium]